MDHDEHRGGEEHEPAERVTRRRAHDGVRRDAARVIVRRARNQARSEHAAVLDELAALVLRGPFGFLAYVRDGARRSHGLLG